jgi:HD-like signal output (HDOD) protein
MSTDRINQELDDARRSGPVRDIIIPPCPELLVRLQAATATAEPDVVEIDRIASADVAMAAALIRQANSPLYALEHRVNTVGQAMTVIGLQPAVRLAQRFSDASGHPASICHAGAFLGKLHPPCPGM